MNLLQVAESPVLKGTFIEELFETIQAGKFVDPEVRLKPGDQVVGEMNDLERALYALSGKYVKTERALTNRLSGRGEPYSSEEMAQMKADLARCRGRSKVAGALLWANIEERFAGRDKSESTGWGVRSGHQVVLTFGDDHEHEDFLKALLGLSLLRGTMKD